MPTQPTQPNTRNECINQSKTYTIHEKNPCNCFYSFNYVRYFM